MSNAKKLKRRGIKLVRLILGISLALLFMIPASSVVYAEAWRIADAEYVGGKYMGEPSPRDVVFNTDGTKMFVLTGHAPSYIRQYALSTAWDISTVGEVPIATFNLPNTGEVYRNEGLYIAPDGLSFYTLVAYGTDLNKVLKYDMTEAWDINSAVAVHDHTSPKLSEDWSAGIAYSLFFSSDGTKFWVGLRGWAARIYEFTMSEAWNPSTASTGEELHLGTLVDDNDFKLYPKGIHFKDDGSKLYVAGSSSWNGKCGMIEITLSEAWDISTATWSSGDSKSLTDKFDNQADINIFIENDGIHAYVTGEDKILQYEMVPQPPAVSSAETSVDGTVITIDFNKAMADPTGKHDQFTYKINGGDPQNFSAAALDGDTTKINLTTAGTSIAHGDIVTISYTAGDVLAADGGILASFTDQAVTNNVQEAPTMVGAETSVDGTVITIEFSKAMADPTGKHDQFNYQINGGADQGFSAAALAVDTTKINLTVAGTAIAHGDIVTVSYTAGDVEAADGGLLASFSDQPVANNMPVPSGSVIGTFDINQAPTVDLVNLVPTSLTPQVEYTVTVTVSDADTLDDLSTVVLKLWYDADGGDPSEGEFDAATPDARTTAVITWTNGSGFALSAGDPTSWALGACTAPTLSETTGDFTFVFTVGKVATEASSAARWQVAAKATDSADQTGFGFDAEGAAMNWYGEITVPAETTVDWRTLPAGLDFEDPLAQQPVDATINYISNGDFDMQVRSAATWSGDTHTAVLDPTGETVAAQEFALKANDTDAYETAELVGTSPITIGTDTQTGEDGLDVGTMNLWIKLASSFQYDVYSGAITYSIVNQ